jgi:hypothetical protein
VVAGSNGRGFWKILEVGNNICKGVLSLVWMVVGGFIFWHDVWCENLAFKDALSDLYLISLLEYCDCQSDAEPFSALLEGILHSSLSSSSHDVPGLQQVLCASLILSERVFDPLL